MAEQQQQQQQQHQQQRCSSLIGSYWLTRIVFLRFLALIFVVAFVVLLNQRRGLISSEGLYPSGSYLDAHLRYFTKELKKEPGFWWLYLEKPTVFWLSHTDAVMETLCYIGLFLAVLASIGVGMNAVVFFALWLIYQSFEHVGQIFYGYGWEMQLLETGFLALMWCPLLSSANDIPIVPKTSSLARQNPFVRNRVSALLGKVLRWLGFFQPSGASYPSMFIVWALLWLEFRIMLGAGLIKLRSHDDCWKNLTCLYYHYETQPIPNPLSWYIHQMPHWFHQCGVLTNHLVELIIPWLLFIPWRKGRIAAGYFFCGFQVALILSGNLSFLNYLTIAPALACFDDEHLQTLFSADTVHRVRSLRDYDLSVSDSAARDAQSTSPVVAIPSSSRNNSHMQTSGDSKSNTGTRSSEPDMGITGGDHEQDHDVGDENDENEASGDGRESTPASYHRTELRPLLDPASLRSRSRIRSGNAGDADNVGDGNEQQQQQQQQDSSLSGFRRRCPCAPHVQGRRLWQLCCCSFNCQRRCHACRSQACVTGTEVVRLCCVVAFFCLIGVLSYPVVMNLYSSDQMMNYSFDRFNLVNTYGAFGTVGKIRHEVVLEGTMDAQGRDGWKEIEFNCKPGNVSRTPCVCAPYQYRVDWQIWFAAMQDAASNPWLIHLVYKLLHHSQPAIELLHPSYPFKRKPPKIIRARLYKYQFTKWADPDSSSNWWHRELVGEYLPPLSKSDKRLQSYVENHDWPRLS